MRRSTFGLVVGLFVVVGTSTWVVAQSGPAGLQGAWTIQDVQHSKRPDISRKNQRGSCCFRERIRSFLSQFAFVETGTCVTPAPTKDA